MALGVTAVARAAEAAQVAARGSGNDDSGFVVATKSGGGSTWECGGGSGGWTPSSSL